MRLGTSRRSPGKQEPPTLGNHLYESFIQSRHCDVELSFVHADFEHQLSAHRMVLERAEFFRALFSGPLSAKAAAAASHVVVLDDPNITKWTRCARASASSTKD